MSDSLQPHGLQYTRLPCPSPAPGAYSSSCPLSRWCHLTILSSVVPFYSSFQSFSASAAAAAKSLQSCPTLCDPIDSSPPGSTVPGILQARTLEWVAISFSSTWKWKGKVKSLSCVRLFATPWTAAYQAPPFMGFPDRNTGVGCHYLPSIWVFSNESILHIRWPKYWSFSFSISPFN